MSNDLSGSNTASPPRLPGEEELIGQPVPETILARALQRGHVGHAYLFVGAAGSGKETAARLFARALMCERQPAVEARRPSVAGCERDLGANLRLAPCDCCRNCRAMLSGTHPEVAMVHPDSKTGAVISIEFARELRVNAALRPRFGARRIYIVPRASAFSEDASNALLKTLEEPPAHLTLLLCAPHPGAVLPTIRSRCQLLRFGPVPRQELTSALRRRGTSEESARFLAALSGGQAGIAFELAADPTQLQRRTELLDLVRRVLGSRSAGAQDSLAGVRALRFAEDIRALARTMGESEKPARGRGATAAGVNREESAAQRERQLLAELLLVFQGYLRDALVLSMGCDGALVRNGDRISDLQEFAQRHPPGRHVSDLQLVQESVQLLERNTTPALVLERLMAALLSGS